MCVCVSLLGARMYFFSFSRHFLRFYYFSPVGRLLLYVRIRFATNIITFRCVILVVLCFALEWILIMNKWHRHLPSIKANMNMNNETSFFSWVQLSPFLLFLLINTHIAWCYSYLDWVHLLEVLTLFSRLDDVTGCKVSLLYSKHCPFTRVCICICCKSHRICFLCHNDSVELFLVSMGCQY